LHERYLKRAAPTPIRDPDYPLPPDEDTTDVLREVVLEFTPINLLDRLISDSCDVATTLLQTDAVDLATSRPASARYPVSITST
jgi:hypothetical protein